MTVATAVGRLKAIPFAARIVAAMLLGALVGTRFGREAAWLGELGTVLIDLIKALAGPLLFVSVVDAMLRTAIGLRGAAWMVAISITNALIAVAIGLTLSNVLQPGRHLAASTMTANANPGGMLGQVKEIRFLKEVELFLPRNLVQPFLDNSVISIVILAVLLGGALRSAKQEQQRRGETAYLALENGVATIYRALEILIGWVIALIPLAVFGVVARTIGRDGFSPIRGLLWYVGVAVLGLGLQILVVYQAWVVLIARKSLRWFWTGARDAIVYAVGASSSLATLPVTLRCLDSMGVSPQSARLAACVGTNLNNDGILLYEAMAVLFVAQVYGIDLTIGQQLLAAGSCILAGIGIAAIPDAGLISLALVLKTVGLPLEIVQLLLTVDWLLSRCRAVTNVTSDMVVAVVLDRLRGEESKLDRFEEVSDPSGI